VALGATEDVTHGDDRLRWTVMRDPDGDEFCVRD
jgi:Glyoxalase-like domain